MGCLRSTSCRGSASLCRDSHRGPFHVVTMVTCPRFSRSRHRHPRKTGIGIDYFGSSLACSRSHRSGGRDPELPGHVSHLRLQGRGVHRWRNRQRLRNALGPQGAAIPEASGHLSSGSAGTKGACGVAFPGLHSLASDTSQGRHRSQWRPVCYSRCKTTTNNEIK